MKDLTDKEMELMEVIWANQAGLTMRELYELLPEPRTHFNTVSTFIRRLEEEGFISHETIKGRLFKYKPAISRWEYERREQKSFLDRFFKGSGIDFVKHLFAEEQVSKEELEELIREINK